MADKAISELVAAPSVTPDSLFVLQQDNTAKKLTAQVLENWLLSFAGGHGGIQSYELLNTVGLVKTYRFTLADQTHIDIDVVDGRGIESIKPTSTNGLVVTYTITYNDGTTSTFNVTNGAKGDKGDRADIWVKYASQKPTASSHSFGDVPDSWIGIATGHNMDTAPTDWQQYTWFQWKGEKGDPGEPATLISSQVTYQVGDSGTIIPSGSWSESIPPVSQGKYLWTREITQFNTGNPITKYSVSRFGIDGTGSVSTVAGVSPDADGNVPLTAADVKALPVAGGTMEGPINMNGQKLTGLNAPTKDDEAANMGFVNQQVKKAAPRNLLDNSDFTNPVNQRGAASYNANKSYTIDRWIYRGATASALSIGDGCITLKKADTAYTAFKQAINPDEHNLFGKTVTAAIKVNNVAGTCDLRLTNSNSSDSDTYAFEKEQFTSAGIILLTTTVPETLDYKIVSVSIAITSDTGSCSIEWAALYEGEYTADNLPVYQPKGYGAELAECLRYYETKYIFSVAGKQVYAKTHCNLPANFTNKRIVPTVTVADAWAPGYFAAHQMSIIGVENITENGCTIQSSNLELEGHMCQIRIAVSADL